jgi:dTDP-4-amino-4,6-dideoxygalactose transaminase
MITATKPFVPPLEAYQHKISTIFDNQWFTNHGPLVTEFENKLREHFQSPYLLVVSNGTIAIQIAIKALGLKGEIITTPFSYVATTSSIVWENCLPVFADIDPDTFNLDPATIESHITPSTSAILATNVYGYPCDFNAIEAIAQKHGLAVIYDNAHGFDTFSAGVNTMNFGDISTISFHATKLFHSVEGGAIVCKDQEVYERVRLLRNFGHTSPVSFSGVGINGKMNEMCAAMGLVNFDYIADLLSRRKRQWEHYFTQLSSTSLTLARYGTRDVEYNHAYFPVVFPSEHELLKTMDLLAENGISTRRYFYPSLNRLDYVKSTVCPVSDDLSARVMCLPLYHELSFDDQDRIIRLIQVSC